MLLIVDTALILLTTVKRNRVKTKITEFKELVPLEKELVFEYDTDVNLKDILDLDYDEIIDTTELGEKNYLLESKKLYVWR